MEKDLHVTELDNYIIKEKIHIIRGKKVMLDRDLAELYGVETKVLNQAVRRNLDRFPEDFMFELTKEEAEPRSRSQIVTLNRRGGNIKYLPYAFPEQGIAMLSSVLNSPKAIQINIQIIRIFTKLREMVDTYKELRQRINEMEKFNVKNFNEIFKILKLLVTEEEKPKEKIGFDTGT